MADLKQQLEYFRDNRRNALAIIISRIDKEDRVVKTFPRSELAAAEKWAASVRPSRITDMKRDMEVIRVYLADE